MSDRKPGAVPGRASASSILADAVLGGAVLAVAATLRLAYLSDAVLNADSLGPFLKAYSVLAAGRWIPPSHAPETGYAFYYCLLPAVLLASSVRGLMRNYFLIHALAPLAVYVGARLAAPGLGFEGWSPRTRAAVSRTVAFVAGMQLALSIELINSAQAGARGYLAPVIAAAATAGVLAGTAGSQAGAALAVLLLPVAAMVHPFTIALLPPTALLWWGWVRARGPRLPLLAALGAVVIAAPRVWQLASPFLTYGWKHAQTLRGIAEANVDTPDPWAPLAGALKGLVDVSYPALRWSHVEWLAAIPALLLIGVAARPAGTRASVFWLSPGGVTHGASAFALWAGGAVAGLFAAGYAIGYLQPYHLRIVFPVMAVAGAWLIALGCAAVERGLRAAFPRVPGPVAALPYVLGAAAAVAAHVPPHFSPTDAAVWDPPRSRLGFLEAVSAEVRRDARDRTLVVESVHLLRSGPAVYPAAVVLDHWVGGAARDRYVTRPDAMEEAAFYLMLMGPPDFVAAAERASPEEGRPPTVLMRDPLEAGEDPAWGDFVLVRLDGLVAAREWLMELCRLRPEGSPPFSLGGTYDYMGPLDPDMRTEYAIAFVPECLTRP